MKKSKDVTLDGIKFVISSCEKMLSRRRGKEYERVLKIKTEAEALLKLIDG